MNFKAFALTGRMVDCWFTQGECPGLGASAPSGRVGHGLYFLLNYHFLKKHGIFPRNAPDFSQESPDFSQIQQFIGKSVGEGLQENEGIFLLFC